ncbi:MAG: helix-turn-helix domain-containing protein [Clostridiales bacterium]|nr:helix-turn-helix domain-containing protein [Clostridiales bacterium]
MEKPSMRRFMTLEDVQECLAINKPQAYSLVRSGELRALRIGGRGEWRVEFSELEAYIERAYAETARLYAKDGAGDEDQALDVIDA